MKKKKKDRLVIVLLCVVVGIIVSAAAEVGPVRAWRAYHDKEVREQRERPRQYTIWDEEYVQAQIMVYLEERYHEKFVMKSYTSNLGTWNGNFVIMKVWPEGKEDDAHLFEVTGYRNENDELDYYDSYVYIRLEKEMEEYFQPFVDEYYNEYLSYYVSFFMGENKCNLPAEISVSELLTRSDYASVTMYLQLHAEPQEDCNYGNMASLAKELQERKFRGKLNIDLFQIDGDNDTSYLWYQTYLFDISDEKIEVSEERTK